MPGKQFVHAVAPEVDDAPGGHNSQLVWTATAAEALESSSCTRPASDKPDRLRVRVDAGHVVGLLLSCRATAGTAQRHPNRRLTLRVSVVQASVLVRVVRVRKLLRTGDERDTVEEKRQLAAVTISGASPRSVAPWTRQHG
eukprot:CAMPEP_0194536142 /NCGR_PEP_ID=MMETSP0253-20130528/74945_1 /TAXON_ID=2966 /ORGANISM="Noctiluca scintillans" /LENGTH=140 /DNA_ID=CAMNT_0039382023 /DNA_START=8 /DNA_END=426 /DNA_ORIENTATION=+